MYETRCKEATPLKAFFLPALHTYIPTYLHTYIHTRPPFNASPPVQHKYSAAAAAAATFTNNMACIYLSISSSFCNLFTTDSLLNK